MRRSLNRVLTVRPALLIVLAFSLLFFPIEWVIGWFVAALIHEVFHILAIKMFRIQIFAIDINVNGTVIETATMSIIQELICSLAGPIGALSMLLLARSFPHIAACVLLQSAFNLLPIFPLDGGRALKSLCDLLLGQERSAFVIEVFNKTTFFLVISLNIMCVLFNLWHFTVILTVILFHQAKALNITCKPT